MARSGGLGRGGVRQPGSFGRRGRPVRSVSLAESVASDPLSELIGGLQAKSQGAGQVRGGSVGNFVGGERYRPSADHVPAARPPRSRVVENADYEQFLDWMDGKFNINPNDARNPEAGSADAAFFAPAPAPVSLPEAPRMQPGSFNMDPGMRARDEFQNVASAGYNQNAQRVAERGGAKQYETSVQEEQAGERSASARNQMLMALLMAMGPGVLGKGAGALGRGAGSRGAGQAADMMRAKGMNPGYTPGGRGFPPGMMNRIKAALGSKAGTAAIDTAAFGGMAATPVYDMVQRHGRGARPFGPGR